MILFESFFRRRRHNKIFERFSVVLFCSGLAGFKIYFYFFKFPTLNLHYDVCAKSFYIFFSPGAVFLKKNVGKNFMFSKKSIAVKGCNVLLFVLELQFFSPIFFIFFFQFFITFVGFSVTNGKKCLCSFSSKRSSYF